jgi:hypothetical protein
MLMPLGRHIGKPLPGNPAIVPKNMPGAGGRKLAASLPSGAMAPNSASSSARCHRSAAGRSASLEIPKFTWINGPSSTTDICAVWHTSPVRRRDLKRPTDLAGSGGETAQVNLVRCWAADEVIIGYQRRKMMLALQRKPMAVAR